MIRKATAADLDTIVSIYNEILDAEEAGLTTTGWIRGLYPLRSVPEAALERDDLYVIEDDGEIKGSGIINHIQAAEYRLAPWEHEADAEHVCVLHTLTISPQAFGQGLGKQFIAFYEAYAREHGCRELRIDTNVKNTAARSLYKKLGYKEIIVVPTVFNGIPDVEMVIMEKYLDGEEY